MRLFRTPPYVNIPELLDNPVGASEHELSTTLRDIRRANIFGLGTWVIKHHLEGLLRYVPIDRQVRILDLATGSGDIPEELCRWARKSGRPMRIFATDISAEILAVARHRIINAGFGGQVEFMVCDACAPPFHDEEFDIALCSLALHHMDKEQAVELFRQMRRVSSLGFIVNDIYRSRGAWLMAWLLTHLTTTNRFTRHDATASVLRAYTPGEVRRIAARVGVRVSVQTHPFWRMAATWSSRNER